MTNKDFSKIDKIFVPVCFVLGYFFIRWCLFGGVGIGVTAVGVLLLIAQTIYFILSHKPKPDLKTIIAFCVTLIFAAGFCLTASPFALVFNYIAFILGTVYVYYRACGNGISNHQGDYFFFDILKSVFVIPLCNLESLWSALLKKTEKQKEQKSGGSIIIGLLIAIIPVCIVTTLLSSDIAFSIALSKIFKFDLGEIAFSLFCLFIGTPVAMYFFGMIYGNAKHPVPEILTAEKADTTAEKVKIIPRITVYGAVIPLLFVYLFFFASQLIYFVSALQKMLPNNFSYAQYARRGFFELCAVCVINFAVICFMSIFTKRLDGKETRILRTLKVTLCIFTEAIIAIDIAKMFLYINEFGLTQKRVMTSWFMVLLGILFLLLLLKQIFPKFKITTPAVTAAVILSAVLIFSNVDAIVAGYNVSAYQNKKLESVDIYAMYKLDDSAVSFIIPLLDDPDYEVYVSASNFLSSRAESIKNRNLNEYTIHTFYAKKLLTEKGFIK